MFFMARQDCNIGLSYHMSLERGGQIDELIEVDDIESNC